MKYRICREHDDRCSYFRLERREWFIWRYVAVGSSFEELEQLARDRATYQYLNFRG